MDKQLVGKRLKLARGKRTKKEIAISAGFADSAIGRWEKGEQQIGIIDFLSVCNALGVSPSEILEEKQPAWMQKDQEILFRRLKSLLTKLHEEMPDAEPNIVELYCEHAKNLLHAVRLIQ